MEEGNKLGKEEGGGGGVANCKEKEAWPLSVRLARTSFTALRTSTAMTFPSFFALLLQITSSRFFLMGW